MLKYDFLALEKNLNLLSEKDLIEICNRLEIKNFKINRVKYFGFNSNLILIINKN